MLTTPVLALRSRWIQRIISRLELTTWLSTLRQAQPVACRRQFRSLANFAGEFAEFQRRVISGIQDVPRRPAMQAFFFLEI
jgi:hypothetical protein